MVVGLVGPDSGRVLLDGLDVTDAPMYIRARKGIGYLPQEASIFRGLTVEQNISAILETTDLDAAGRRARLRELLAELDLTRLAKSPGLYPVGGRAAPGRDHPGPGDLAEVHSARRAVRGDRPDRRVATSRRSSFT